MIGYTFGSCDSDDDIAITDTPTWANCSLQWRDDSDPEWFIEKYKIDNNQRKQWRKDEKFRRKKKGF